MSPKAVRSRRARPVSRPSARRRLLPAVLLGALAGCGPRAAVRDAAYGVFDAVQNPPQGDRLVHDLRALVQAYVERALKAGPPEELSKVAGKITGEVLKSIAAAAEDNRELVGDLVSEALRAGIATMKQEVPGLSRGGAGLAPAIERTAGESGASLARGAMGASLAELEREAKGAGQGPLAQAALEMAQRTAGATVHGATSALRAELASLPPAGAPGSMDLARSTTRAITEGAFEAVRRETGLWLIAAAFVLGLLVAGVIAVLVVPRRWRGPVVLPVRSRRIRGPRSPRR